MRGNVSTGLRVELVLDGAEQLFLPLPVDDAGQPAQVLLEHAVETLARRRKEKQLFLNLRGEMSQLQDLAEPRPATCPASASSR